MRLRVAVEVNVAVTLGLACERALFGGAGIAKLLGRAAGCACSDGASRLGSLARNARFGDSDTRLLEEVSYETLVLETYFGGSLVRSACFADSKREF